MANALLNKSPQVSPSGIPWPTGTSRKVRRKKSGRERLEIKPLEDELAFKAMLKVNLPGRLKTGAYVLQNNDELKFVFGFECKGIHSYLPSQKVDKIFDKLEAGLKNLPQGEQITFHLGAFSSDTKRQTQLQELIRNAPNDELRFLLKGDCARIQQLARRGLREPKFLRIYVTYTLRKHTHGAADWIEKLLSWLESTWHHYKGSSDEFHNHKLKRIITKAFTDGFYRWYNLITNDMGLEAKPLSENDLWAVLWKRFNQDGPIPIPQLITLDEKGLKEEIHSEVHPVTLLIAKAIPYAHREWTYVNDHYVGAFTFLTKPGGWSDKLSQLRYLWEAIARDEIIDTEIFTQLSPANQSIVRTETQRLTKQSNVIAITASKHNSINVAAQVRVKRSVAAQERLYEGETAINASVVFLVHRKRLDELESAKTYLESCFQAPAWLAQEKQYAWKLWLDTLPVVWNPQLVKPYDRRKTYLTSEVVGLIPIICTHPTDKEGLELVAEDGGTPVFLDLFTQHRNIGIFSRTRGGKSTAISAVLTQAQARSWPIVVLDFPKETGESTFSTYTRFVGGSYFDITKERLNIFQLPDLRSLPSEIRQERFEDYKDFLLSFIMLRAGNTSDELLNQTIRSVASLALDKFFSDKEINRRYTKAIEDGFGSRAWQATPTLKDFINFCTPEYVPASAVAGDASRALQQVRLSLQSLLVTRVGRAISNPSTIRSDAQLVVFALRGLNNDYDAALMALAAYGLAKSITLKSPDSLLFIDEGAILFQFLRVAEIIARECANGAKAGKRVIVCAQDPNTITESPYGSQIIQNLSARLIGVIEQAAIKSFKAFFEIPDEIISNNAMESFFPNPEGLYSRWLLDTKGVYTICRFYPSRVGLGVVANNSHEEQARQWFLDHYSDKYEAISAFSTYLETWIREGKQPPLPEIDNHFSHLPVTR